ncbi:MAG: DNA cytosine methyltransferase [Ardenticatenaceae bacterium]
MWTQLSLFDSSVNSDYSSVTSGDYQAAAASSDLALDGRTVAEFFAGIGLVRLGLEQAGWPVIWANDIDLRKYAMYKSAFPDAAAHYVVEDVFELDPARIPPTTLVTASFPCIDLSLAGKQQGLAGKHSSAFWGFWEILRTQAVRPPIVLLENVPGFLTSNKGQDFRTTIQALNELGYWCDVIALDALHFTPQSRLRLFVIAIQPQLKPAQPSPLHERSSWLMPKSLKEAFSHNRDLAWHFLPCPPPPPKRKAGLTTIVEEMAADDPRWWHEDQVARHLAMMSPTHHQRAQILTQAPVMSYRTFYRRTRQGQQRVEIRKGDTAGCLRTARGGSSRQMLVAAGKGNIKMRHVTPREYARLQGVPDDYPIPPNTLQALTGFGDAVCVPAIRWIAEKLLNPLVSNQN